MITLGLGELMVDVADAAGVLWRRGRHLVQPRGRRAGAGHQLRPADPALLPDRGLLLCVHGGGDVCADAHAAGRMLNAVRDNPERVEFIGYDTQWCATWPS